MNENEIPGFGPIAEGAQATHRLFLAYIDAGFKREEALKLIIGIAQGMATAQGHK